jgi:cobalt-zinc-cadmium efflux system outer membrane protein
MNRSIAFGFCVVVLILPVYSCFAESSQDRPDANHALSNAEGAPVTLQDYLYYAALNNAGLKAAFEQWKAAVEQVPQSKALPDPKFTYGYFIREVETRAGPQKQRFGIMQVFPWLGKIEARTDAAAAAARAARKRYDARKLKLFYETRDAFYEYAYLARAVEIATENLELIKHFEEVARTKYMAAAAKHPDVIRAQVELAKLQDHLKTLEELRKPIVARLNAVLNRRSFEMLPWPQKEELRTANIDRQQLIEILRMKNPELQALIFEIEAAGHKITLAKKKFWPDIGVGLDWIQTDGAIMSGTKDSSKDPVILMFTLDIPIWRDSYKAAELQAMAEMSRTFQQKTEMENNIIAQVERALYDFEDSDRKIKLYGDVLVPKAEELLGASETAYKAGKMDFLSLINAQQKLLEFQLQYERVVTNNQQRLAELEMLAGTELPVETNIGN